MSDRAIDDVITDDGNVDIRELRSRLHDIEDEYIHGFHGAKHSGNYEGAWQVLRADLHAIEQEITDGTE